MLFHSEKLALARFLAAQSTWFCIARESAAHRGLRTSCNFVELPLVNTLSNSTKVWLFLVGCAVSVLLLCFELFGRTGLWISFVFVILGYLFVYFLGDCPLLDFLSAQAWRGTDPWGLSPSFAKYAALAQVPVPLLYICDNPHPFAFAIGGWKSKGVLCFSTGLLNRLSEKERQAVTAQLMFHQMGLERLRIEIAQVLAFTFVGLGQLLDKVVLRIRSLFGSRRPSQFFSKALAPVGWFLLRIFVSRQIYYKNDHLAAEMLGDRQPLADALWKMDEIGQLHPLRIPPCTSHFFIVSPSRKMDFFLIHPKIDLRLKKLIGYYPI